jgi:AcrR family transcriptional regulator
MGRPQGKHNEDYEQKREALLEKLGPRLVATADRASFREMAAFARVSVPTLRHYFTDRNGVIRAWLEWKGGRGRQYLTTLSWSDEDFAASIRSMLAFVAMGMDRGRVIELHIVGLAEGLTNPSLGPTYLQSILEPTLAAAEARLSTHMQRGEMRQVDVRAAALALLSPLILAMLHQRDLGGETLRCLNVDAFIESHAGAFVLAYGAQPAR